MILVFFGPPGSGKGTQAKLLAADQGLPHLSTGDMFRSAIQAGTPLGKQAQVLMDQGALVPDELVLGLIQERIQRPDCDRGFILDGFPRNVAQAQRFQDMLTAQGRVLHQAILFSIQDELLVERLSGRRTCPQCSAMYHIRTAQPKQGGQCDQCGTALIQRPDDQVEVIQKRLNVYHDQTEPMAEFYHGLQVLRRLDAAQAAAAVTKELRDGLRSGGLGSS
jgi:adenylate kinase